MWFRCDYLANHTYCRKVSILLQERKNNKWSAGPQREKMWPRAWIKLFNKTLWKHCTCYFVSQNAVPLMITENQLFMCHTRYVGHTNYFYEIYYCIVSSTYAESVLLTSWWKRSLQYYFKNCKIHRLVKIISAFSSQLMLRAALDEAILSGSVSSSTGLDWLSC